MENTLKKIENNDNFQDVYNKIVYITNEIPFWNSDFQNKNSIVNKEWSIHRWYRSASLHILDRLNALKSAKTKIDRNNIEIERKNREIKRLENDKPLDYDLDIKNLTLDIEEIENWYEYSLKLIKDAITEINSLLPFFNSVWKITKEEFEDSEEEYYKNRFLEQASKKDENIKLLESMWYRFNNKDWKLLLEKTEKTLIDNTIEIWKDNILHLDQ